MCMYACAQARGCSRTHVCVCPCTLRTNVGRQVLMREQAQVCTRTCVGAGPRTHVRIWVSMCAHINVHVHKHHRFMCMVCAIFNCTCAHLCVSAHAHAGVDTHVRMRAHMQCAYATVLACELKAIHASVYARRCASWCTQLRVRMCLS